MSEKDKTKAKKSNVRVIDKALKESMEADEKGGLGTASEAEGKINQYDLFRNVVNDIESLSGPDFPFEATISMLEAADGTIRPIVIEKDERLRFVSKMHINRLVFQHCDRNDYQFTQYKVNQVVDMWMGLCNVIDESKVIPIRVPNRESHRNKYNYHALPFNPKKQDTPTFDKLLDRVKGKSEFMAFIGSLFDENSDRSQYMWIYGEGGNGKSQFLAALSNVLGQAYLNSYVPNRSSERFFTSTIIGRRLVAFPDCSQPAFVTTGFFKSLTGDDSHFIDPKGKDQYPARIFPKFIFSSNERPSIADNKAERRRAILIDIEPFDGEDIGAVNYRNLLVAEMPGIIERCIAEYEEHTITGAGKIQITSDVEETINDAIEEGEMYFESVFEDTLHVCNVSEVKGSELVRILYAHGIKRGPVIKKFTDWLKNRYKVKKVKKSSGIWYQGVGKGMKKNFVDSDRF